MCGGGIGDFFSDVGDAVSDVVEGVGDAVSDIGGSGAGAIIGGIAGNLLFPGAGLLAVGLGSGLGSFGGTLVTGGSFGGALKNGVMSGALGAATAGLGGYLSGAVGGSSLGGALGNIGSKALGYGLAGMGAGALGSALQGGDVGKGALFGGLGGAAGGALSASLEPSGAVGGSGVGSTGAESGASSLNYSADFTNVDTTGALSGVAADANPYMGVYDPGVSNVGMTGMSPAYAGLSSVPNTPVPMPGNFAGTDGSQISMGWGADVNPVVIENPFQGGPAPAASSSQYATDLLGDIYSNSSASQPSFWDAPVQSTMDWVAKNPFESAALGLGALSVMNSLGGPQQPQQRTGALQPSQSSQMFNAPLPQYSYNGQNKRNYIPYQGNFSTYGQAGGSHTFFDPIVSTPV